jgi:hypothetical protein
MMEVDGYKTKWVLEIDNPANDPTQAKTFYIDRFLEECGHHKLAITGKEYKWFSIILYFATESDLTAAQILR